VLCESGLPTIVDRHRWLSAEAAADLRLTCDGEELTGKVRFFFGLGDREGLLRGALKCIGNRVEPECGGGSPDLAQLTGD